MRFLLLLLLKAMQMSRHRIILPIYSIIMNENQYQNFSKQMNSKFNACRQQINSFRVNSI